MNYLANLNKNHLMSFLVLSIGALILGLEDRSGISNHYYITDRDFTIKQGGIINVEYGVKQNDSYLSGGLLPVNVEFTGGDEIRYGYLPQVANLTLRTFSVCIYTTAYPPSVDSYIIGLYSNEGAASVSVTPSGAVEYRSKQLNGASTTTGWWDTPAASVPKNAWVNIVVTRNMSNPTANPTTPPIIYINGIAQVLTVISVALGAEKDETGATLGIGNVSVATNVNTYGFDGKIFDPRVYNRILTPAEVTALYNAGVPDETLVTDGLVFQGMSTYADNPLAAGHVLTSADRLVENIVRAVGVPHGAPIIRANP